MFLKCNIIILNFVLSILVLGTYYLFYLPAIIQPFLSHSWQFYVRSIIAVLPACNGIASPLIYVWQSETIRLHICIMYGLKKQTNARSRSTALSISSSVNNRNFAEI